MGYSEKCYIRRGCPQNPPVLTLLKLNKNKPNVRSASDVSYKKEDALSTNHKQSHNIHSDRKRELALAAYEVFLAKGYAGASMTAVAKSAGISKSSLYHHFNCKQEMFLSALTAEVEGPLDALESIIEDKTTCPEDRFVQVLGIFHDAMMNASMGKMVAVIVETASKVPEVAKGFSERYINRFRQAMCIAYADVIEHGSHKHLPMRVVEQIIFGPLLSNAMTEAMFSSSDELKEVNLALTKRGEFISMIELLTRKSTQYVRT